MNTHVFSVTEVNGIVRDLLENSITPLWLSGEVGNLTIHSSGHVYLTLKDASSQLKAVYFNGAGVCKSIALREGMQVEVYGRLSVYSARGEYQFNVRSMRLFGIGGLQMKFEELKQKLSAEGIFDPARKKEIPFLPLRIGVASSVSGAALKDFIRIALSRFPELHIKICPVPVQGKGAEAKLAMAVRFFNRADSVDVIVLTRGGGSLEDLWPFNEEILARAIAESRIPVVSAVGHEIDFTISDFAADLRAPTPSGAAEMIVPEKAVLQDTLKSAVIRMNTAMSLQLERAKAKLDSICSSRAFLDLNYQVENRIQKIDRDMEELTGLLALSVERAENRLTQAMEALKAYSPYGVLQRGYAIVTDSDGHVIRSVKQVKTGDNLTLRVFDGTIQTEVHSTKKSSLKKRSSSAKKKPQPHNFS